MSQGKNIGLDKIELRVVIKYQFLKGKSPKEIHQDMQETLGSDAVSYSLVKKWVSRFKMGQNDIQDDPRSGRPISTTTPENVEAIHEMILQNRRISSKDIAETMRMSKERV